MSKVWQLRKVFTRNTVGNTEERKAINEWNGVCLCDSSKHRSGQCDPQVFSSILAPLEAGPSTHTNFQPVGNARRHCRPCSRRGAQVDNGGMFMVELMLTSFHVLCAPSCWMVLVWRLLAINTFCTTFGHSSAATVLRGSNADVRAQLALAAAEADATDLSKNLVEAVD